MASTSLLRAVWFLGAGFLVNTSTPQPVQAQTQYSVNAVGYADVTLYAGSNFVGNRFYSKNDTVSNLLQGVPAGTFVRGWNPAVEDFNPTNWYRAETGWTDPNERLVIPNGALIFVPAQTSIAFAGEVPIPSGVVARPAGMTVITELPVTFQGVDNNVLRWRHETGGFDLYTMLFGGMWDPVEPVLWPGEAIIVQASASYSVRTYMTPAPPFRVRLECRRTAGQLSLTFPASAPVSYTLLRSGNLGTNVWDVLAQDTVSPVTGVATLNTAFANDDAGFYRLAPRFATSVCLLMSARRAGNEFHFEFNAPVSSNYTIQRAGALSGPWQNTVTLAAAANTVVSVLDTNAAAAGYYRISY